MIYAGGGGTSLAPSGDTTGATDTAAVNTISQAGKAALLTAGTYYMTNLLPDSYGAIIGQGQGTILQGVAGTTGYMIALKTPATTKQVTIANLTLNPATGSLGGINLDNTGYGTGSDPLHTIDNVLVTNAGGDSFRFDNNMRELRVTRCKAYFSGGYGFYIGTGCTDSHFTDCTSGQSVNHGWNLAAGGNNVFTACKAFYAGYNHGSGTWGTTQCGFAIAAAQNNVLAGCSAQQNALHGFDLQGTIDTTLAGCEADTNSAGNAVTTGVGINTNGAQYCAIIGCSGANYGSLSPGAQKYGIQVAGNQTGTVFTMNTVTGSSGPFNYVSGFGYTFLSQSQTDFGAVPYFKIPAPVLSNDSPQALSNASTILVGTDGNYGAIPVTATGNVTGIILEAPTAAWSKITVVNQSAFTVTFAASGTSHVADGVTSLIPMLSAQDFVYDNNTSLWYQCGSPAAISNTSKTAPVLTALGAASTVATQLSDLTRDYMVYLEITTAGTATSLSIGSTSSANDVTIVSSAVASAGTLWSFRLPAGWWFKWSGTTTAVGNQAAVGC